MITLLFAMCVGTWWPSEPPRAFVQVEVEPSEPWVGQRVRVRVAWGFERAFLDDAVVPLFPTPLDLPGQVEAPWLESLEHASWEPVSDAAETGTSFVLGDDLVRGVREEVQRNGAPWSVVRLDRYFVATEPGSITLAAPTLRFAYATEFRSSFLHGRIPEDRVEGKVEGALCRLEVRPQPTQGRPDDYGGAVGRFDVESTLEASEVQAGAPFTVTVTVRGDGSGAEPPLPLLRDLVGFHVQGVLPRMEDGVRKAEITAVALDERVSEWPALRLPTFDPERGVYETIESDPVPLTVHPDPTAPEPTPLTPTETDASESAGSPRVTDDGSATRVGVILPWWLVALGAVLSLLGLASLVTRWRPRGTEAANAPTETSHSNHVTDAAQTKTDCPLIHALAARLGCTEAAVIDETLASRLRASGVDEETAVRWSQAVEATVAARYGAPPTDLDLEAVLRDVRDS